MQDQITTAERVLKLVENYGLSLVFLIVGCFLIVLAVRTVWWFFTTELWPTIKKSANDLKDRFVGHLDRLDSCTEKMSRSVDILNDTMRVNNDTLKSQASGIHRQATQIGHLANAVRSCTGNGGTVELKNHHLERSRESDKDEEVQN